MSPCVIPNFLFWSENVKNDLQIGGSGGPLPLFPHQCAPPGDKKCPFPKQKSPSVQVLNSQSYRSCPTGVSVVM